MADRFIGPILPTNDSGDEKDSTTASYGPALPAHLKTRNEDVDEDADPIGPVLPGSSSSSSVTQEALEERAQLLKYKFLLGVSYNKDSTLEHSV